MRLIQISDTHIVARPGLVAGRLDTAAALERTVAQISALQEKVGPISALLVTGHSDVPDGSEIMEWLATQRAAGLNTDIGRAELVDASGRSLDAGYYVRACWDMGVGA